jgi:hypothetical protein
MNEDRRGLEEEEFALSLLAKVKTLSQFSPFRVRKLGLALRSSVVSTTLTLTTLSNSSIPRYRVLANSVG